MDDEKDKDELDELKGEVLLPETDDEPVDEEEDIADPLLHKHHKKGLDEDSGEDSLDALAEAEEVELPEDSYDDVDLW